MASSRSKVTPHGDKRAPVLRTSTPSEVRGKTGSGAKRPETNGSTAAQGTTCKASGKNMEKQTTGTSANGQARQPRALLTRAGKQKQAQKPDSSEGTTTARQAISSEISASSGNDVSDTIADVQNNCKESSDVGLSTSSICSSASSLNSRHSLSSRSSQNSNKSNKSLLDLIYEARSQMGSTNNDYDNVETTETQDDSDVTSSEFELAGRLDTTLIITPVESKAEAADPTVESVRRHSPDKEKREGENSFPIVRRKKQRKVVES